MAAPRGIPAEAEEDDEQRTRGEPPAEGDGRTADRLLDLEWAGLERPHRDVRAGEQVGDALLHVHLGDQARGRYGRREVQPDVPEDGRALESGDVGGVERQPQVGTVVEGVRAAGEQRGRGDSSAVARDEEQGEGSEPQQPSGRTPPAAWALGGRAHRSTVTARPVGPPVRRPRPAGVLPDRVTPPVTDP